MKVRGVSFAAVLVLLVALVASAPMATAQAGTAAPSSASRAGGTESATGADGLISPSGPSLSRLTGRDRYATSVSVSEHRFVDPAEAQTVYLARGDLFVDALAAGVLRDGPILLVPSCSGVPTSVAAEIARISPATVVALGGPQAVCDATLTAAAGGRATDRLGGVTRYETAALIAARAFPSGSGRVYLAKGGDSPDAVVGGTLTDGPVLLADRSGTGIPPATSVAIASLAPTLVVALGGPAAVSSAALTTAAAGRTTSRLAGADRWATAVEVAKHAFPSGSERVYLARGDRTNYVDAVAAGVLTDGPVLLARGSCDWLPAATGSHLAALDPAAVVALGGEDALCQTVLRQASRAIAPPAVPNCAQVKCVALTFDDGPSAYTARLNDILVQRNVPATFFLVGQMATNRKQTMQELAMEGFQVGNHTWNHPRMNTLTLTQQRAQVTATNDVFNQRLIPDASQLRPPYGLYDSNTRRLGVPLILWSVDPRDWEAGKTTTQIRTHIRNNVHPGAIVLQHDTHSQSVDAVPGIIHDLKDMGYSFVTVEQLVPWADAGDLVYSRGQVTQYGSTTAPESAVPNAPSQQELEQLRDDAPAPMLPTGPLPVPTE